MTDRERKMLVVVGGMGAIFLAVVGWYVVHSITEGFAAQDAQIALLNRDLKNSQNKLTELKTAQAKLNRWREISLPPDPAVANNRYEAFLRELTRQHYLNNAKITPGGMRSAATRTVAQVTPLSFSVTADATLPRVIGFLRDFYGVNLPHAIREMHLAPLPGTNDGRLEVSLRIEALAMPTATSRDYLVAVPDGRLIVLDAITALKHGPVGFALAPWLIGPTGLAGSQKLASIQNDERNYDKLVDKNVFMGLISPLAGSGPGRPDREILKVVELTAITENFLATEAWLRNRLTNKTTFLRAEGGRDTFEVKDTSDRVVLKGKVRHIEHRSVIFEANEKFYVIKLGEFMDKALQKELGEADLKALGVSTATATGNP